MMGYNTVAVLYNDGLHYGVGDAGLGERIQTASRNWSNRQDHRFHIDFFARSGNASASYGRIVSQEHADYSQVVVVGRNTGAPLRECDNLDRYALDQLADALTRHGYTVKKPKRKAAHRSGKQEDAA